MAPPQFKTKDVRDLFRDKKVLFLGDSIMREIYKDFVWLHKGCRGGGLISHDLLIFEKESNEKGEPTMQSTLCGGECLIPGTIPG